MREEGRVASVEVACCGELASVRNWQGPMPRTTYKGRTTVSNQKKANIFAKHYGSVSRLKFSKEERAINLRPKKIAIEARLQCAVRRKILVIRPLGSV
jgi:hypothetical protein